jgi:hypothetical protein
MLLTGTILFRISSCQDVGLHKSNFDFSPTERSFHTALKYQSSFKTLIVFKKGSLCKCGGSSSSRDGAINKVMSEEGTHKYVQALAWHVQKSTWQQPSC